ncbi:MAG: archease [Chloroflexi bacterium]|nr:archease [Chloroflexota bacterium]
MDRRFEEIEHTADVAMRVWGRDLAELFANAAYGLACQLGGPSETGRAVERSIELTAYDAETLLVAWLGELLYLSERDDCILAEFDMLEVAPTRLRATAWGGPVRERGRYIKAVTFNELEIARTDEGYETTIVFDV